MVSPMPVSGNPLAAGQGNRLGQVPAAGDGDIAFLRRRASRSTVGTPVHK